MYTINTQINLIRNPVNKYRMALSPQPKSIYIGVKHTFFSKRIASPNTQIKKMDICYKDIIDDLERKINLDDEPEVIFDYKYL